MVENAHMPDSDGHVISSFNPKSISEGDNVSGAKASSLRTLSGRFRETMLNDAKGLLATDVYHDTRMEEIDSLHSQGIAADEYQALRLILGTNAWKAVNAAKSPQDQHVIDTAIDAGLLEAIEGHSLHFISYGPGPNGTATDKEGRLIANAKMLGRHIDGFTAIDVNRTYAAESSSLLGDKYSVPGHGVIGDFIWGRTGRLPLDEIQMAEGSVKVVTAFGNTPFNAASYMRPDGTVVSYKDGVENFFSKMNIQNGLGHYLVLTVDTEQNPREQEKKYAVTQEHEQLILTPFALARLRGIITEPLPILAHWRMAVRYDQQENTVLMMAQAKNNHSTVLKDSGEVAFSEGQEKTIMVSHKWTPNVHTSILGRSGYDVIEIIEARHNPHQLILAKSVRPPSRTPF